MLDAFAASILFKRLHPVIQDVDDMTHVVLSSISRRPESAMVRVLGIIMSSTVLCTFSKCAYATAAGLYILGAIFDVIIVVRR